MLPPASWNLHAGPEPITKNVDDGSSMMRQHLGGTATHDAGAFGIGADDGDGLQPRGAERKERSRHIVATSGDRLVAQEHHRLHGGPACKCAVLGEIDGMRLHVSIVEGAQTIEYRQQGSCGTIQIVFVDSPLAHGLGEYGSVSTWGRGHFQIETGVRRSFGGESSEPVRHHEALETPLVAQDVLQQPAILRAIAAVHPVVRRHDAERTALAHRDLERQQVHLAKCSIVDDAIDRHAFEFGVVADEVFHGGGHPVRLHSADERGRQSSGEEWILRIALEGATKERRSVEIDGRGQENARILGARLVSEGSSELFEEIGVERGTERGATGNAQRRHLRTDSGRERSASPGGTVGDGDRRNRVTRDVVRGPQRGTRRQRGLFLDGHLAEQRVDVAGHVSDLVSSCERGSSSGHVRYRRSSHGRRRPNPAVPRTPRRPRRCGHR